MSLRKIAIAAAGIASAATIIAAGRRHPLRPRACPPCLAVLTAPCEPRSRHRGKRGTPVPGAQDG
jgi:hypothetical protein